jgi:hypothetical protein
MRPSACRLLAGPVDGRSARPARGGQAVQAAEQLQVAPGSPLLSVERVAYTYQDAPMELRRGLYRTDTHHYRNSLS